MTHVHPNGECYDPNNGSPPGSMTLSLTVSPKMIQAGFDAYLATGYPGETPDFAAIFTAMLNARDPYEASEGDVEAARPLMQADHKKNMPLGDGKRLVGFVLSEEVAGLSDGLSALEALVRLAAITALIQSDTKALGANRALVNGAEDGTALTGFDHGESK